MVTAAPKTPTYNLQPDERASTVMVYTQNALAWGDVILKEAIRPSTWLRTQAIPRFIWLHNAQLLHISAGCTLKPIPFTELHIPSAQVIGFHLKPPLADPPDYDPKEPMRKMEPVSAMVGDFQFDAFIRMSTQSDLVRFLDVSKEQFTSLYDLTITLPTVPAFGKLQTPFALVRAEHIMFSGHTV